MATVTNTFENVKAAVLLAHKNSSTADKIGFYNNWAKNYERDLAVLEYRAPNLAANTISSHFRGVPQTAVVLDVTCGTGLMAKQMKKNGFQRFVGLDGSEAMLEIAKESGLYEDVKQCILGDDPFPVTWVDLFDVVVIIGSLSDGQVPVEVVRDLCRSAKPGGYICMTTRSNRDNQQYKANLEALLKEMEEECLWKLVELTEVERWERAVSENEDGYIPGVVYLYTKL